MAQEKSFTYTIQYTKIADKFFRDHEGVRQEYKGAIQELLFGDHPESIDVRRIKGKRNDYFRIRLGGWRVVYAVIDGKIVVISTIVAGARGDVYKKMSSLK